MLSKHCSRSFQNIPNLFVYQTSLIWDSESVRNHRQTSDRQTSDRQTSDRHQTDRHQTDIRQTDRSVNLRSPQRIRCGLENDKRERRRLITKLIAATSFYLQSVLIKSLKNVCSFMTYLCSFDIKCEKVMLLKVTQFPI